MDRRIKYTKKVIKETFLNLVSEKDIKKITVSEICNLADINRATFYRYYLDTYDLLDKIEEEFVNELKNASNNIESDYSVSSFVEILLSVFLDNMNLVKVLFSNKNITNLLNEVLSIAYNKCKEKWISDLPNLDDEEIEYASLFIFNGALGIINFWVQNDFDKDIKEISQIIEQLSYYGTKRYIYKR